MDISNFSSTYNQILEKREETSPLDAFEIIEENHPEIIDQLFIGLQKSLFFREVFDWLANNGRIFYIDEMLTLYIHAGLDFSQEHSPAHFDQLKEQESAFLRQLKDTYPESLKKCMEIAAQFESHLKLREIKWLPHFDRSDMFKLEHSLFNMGIRSVVYGHTPKSNVSNHRERLFGIDLSMAKHYGNLGGFLEIGKNGIIARRFVSSESIKMTTDILFHAENFPFDLRYDAESLIKAYQQYFITQSSTTPE
ncbi:hypothetical protein ACFL52_05015 [Candidatus Margulisiibacteriota bacterium]